MLGHNGYHDGYSTTTHEFAHTIHQYGLSDADRQIITAAYQAKRALKTQVQWPDGYRLVDPKDPEGDLIDNYSSTNEYEYFAQATNAYLGTNIGADPTTGQLRNNYASWIEAHEPALLPILIRLYGNDPQAALLPRRTRWTAPARRTTSTTATAPSGTR
ncbi:hypothetical protein NKH18_45305 [Streptomyces sp. M10(2022)]